MSSAPRVHETYLGLERPRWEEPWGPSGEILDRLLCAGQFVVTEPDSSEFICADRAQLLRKLEDCKARGVDPLVRWRRADGSVARHQGQPPPGWGLEDGSPS